MTRRRLALAAILLVGIAYATMIQSFSWNQTSHYDLVRSLNVESTNIDAFQQNTGDKVFYRGHWYSARAPGLALFALPFYDTLKGLDAEEWARAREAMHGEDEMVYLIGLWGNVLPGLLLLLLVWRVAERFEPGYGAAAAVSLGLGTLVLPLSTLLFSHIFSAFLGFGAFALMLRERDGPPSPSLLAIAGLAMGYAVASEYPLFFVALVLGLYLLSRRDAWSARGVLTRAGAYIGGGIVGIVPLLLYNHYAFNSWTHLAYSDVPRQQHGFFGIGAPSLKVLATLLFDSRGLLTISPVLILGAVGTVLLYRRGKRAEALTIGGICLCYVGYNSGYYLPFGGGFMGPRFLTTMLPFLAVPLSIAFKRFPGPTIALAAASIVDDGDRHDHPSADRLRERGGRVDALSQQGLLPADDRQRVSGWGAAGAASGRSCSPPVPASCSPAFATPRVRLTAASLGAGALALLAWGLFAALAPTVLGIDHRGLLSIVGAGDHTALNLTLHDGARYPLTRLVLYAGAGGLFGARRCAPAAQRAARTRRRDGRRRRPPGRQCLLVLTLHFAPCSFLHTTT